MGHENRYGSESQAHESNQRVFEKSWQIKSHGTRTRVRPSCLEAGMGKHGRLNMTESGLFKHPLRPAIKKFFETHRSFINQANNTHGLGPGHNRGKARTNPDAIPLLVKNFKRDALNQPF
jgi:hypothetical protein